MTYDFDPRTNRENLNSKSYPRRLLEDILTNKIVDSMSFGTASNYFTRSYGPNHRIFYEGVGRLLAEILVDTLDNLEDVEYSQLRAEFVATRLMYLVFPDENSVPQGDTHEETISFLLQTYEALLQGATKKSIDEVLNDIAEGNAIVLSTIDGYIADIKSSILATTEYNSDGVFTSHRHFAFTDESGLGSTSKPISFKWGDQLHTHEIIDGVIQPHVDENGNEHTHDVYLGLPENIVRLQSNLRKVFNITKPAHIKTGEIASIIDEDIPILSQNKSDVFSPILGIDSTKTDEEIITENTIDTNLPYNNQNALYGLVGLSLGSLYQEEMRKAREGVYEPNIYGYITGKKIRVWRTNIKVADTLVIGNQKLRVIDVSNRVLPTNGIYEPIQDSNGDNYTYKLVRSLRKGKTDTRIQVNYNLEVINGCLYGEDLGAPFYRGDRHRPEILNDGEPIDLIGEVYFCDLMSDESEALTGDPQLNIGGHRVKLSYIEITVDAVISNQGLQVLKNSSSTWSTRDQVAYETVEFINNFDPLWTNLSFPWPYNYAINIPSYIVKDMLKTKDGLPISVYDLDILVNGNPVNFTYHTLSLEHTNVNGNTNQQDHVLRIFDNRNHSSNSYKALATYGDTITLTYPKAKSEIRRFRELNSIEMTLNAVRPTRKVSLSGRGRGQNRVIETTSPISYVLNEPSPITPYTQEQKIATYSAGSSDLLNTKQQELNSTYTLNNFSLNQTATQDQVFKPATKTLTTSNSKVSFYVLGFRPSFITSVVDENQTSYSYTLNQDHLLIHGLSEEKTLTISGLSSNPFSADLDWFKGDKLGEGQAFYKNTSTLTQGSFEESTPNEYMTNPLGLAPDQIRSIYSMLDTQTSGQQGELTFYEDVITGYDLDGRDGFADEYNPHDPQDEWLYPDPSLYVVGPTAIPTYLFFGYGSLATSGGAGFYFSFYRLDAQGIKQYQTLNLRADVNGFTALEQYPDPVPNGAAIAYKFKDENGGATIDYANSVGANFSASVNASFNHIPNETYYLEVYMEEDNAADYLMFFSSGTDAPYDLGVDWVNSNHPYRLDDLAGGNVDITYTYEITFTLNPGEVKTFSQVPNPSPLMTTMIEDNSIPLDYNAVDNYPQEIQPNRFQWKDLFYPTGFLFASVEDIVPSIGLEVEPKYNFLSGLNPKDDVTMPSDNVTTTLLLKPSTIIQSLAEINDNVSWSLNYVAINRESSVPLIEADVDYNYVLSPINVSDIIPQVNSEVEIPVFSRLVPSSIVPNITDDVSTRVSSISIGSSLNAISDEEGFLVSYLFLPKTLEPSLVPQITDDVTTQRGFVPINVTSNVNNLQDSTLSFISSLTISDEINSLGDLVVTSLDLNESNQTSTIPQINDSVIVPIYQTLELTSSIPSLNDLVVTSMSLYVEDTTPNVSSDAILGFISSIEDNITLPNDDIPNGEVLAQLTLNPLNLEDNITFNADASAFISSTNQTDSTTITISDDVDVQFVVNTNFLYMGLKQPNGSYGFELHIYEAGTEMDSLVYVNSYTTSTFFWSTPDNLDSIGSEYATYLYPANPNAYTNPNDSAIVKIGPLDEDKDYTLFFQSQRAYDGTCEIAMKRGTSNETMTGYISGETYYDLAPNATLESNIPKYFWYHNFRLRSTQQDVVFTQDTTYDESSNPFTDNIRLYLYTKVSPANVGDAFTFYIMSSNDNETATNPVNETIVTLRREASLHLDAGDTTYENVYDESNRYLYTTGSTTDTNPDNEARMSIFVQRGRRMKMVLELDDDAGADISVFLRAHPSEDNGASYNTEYDSNSNLTYTNLAQKDDNGSKTYRHFFYVRDDGFIVWEQDPSSLT